MGKKPKIIRGKLKDKIIRDVTRRFETKKEKRKEKKYHGVTNKDRTIRNIRTLFETKKEKEQHNERLIKDEIIRDIRILCEEEGKGKVYYEPRIGNSFPNNNYIKYESNGYKNKNLSLDEYLNKIETYVRDIIINIKNSDT